MASRPYAPTIVLTGDKALARVFAELPEKVQKQVLRKPLRSAAKIILDRARATAPYDTKKLRKSLVVRAGKRTRKGIVRVAVQTGKDSNLFKGKTFYGAFQEFGWKTGKRGSAKRRQIEGKHFLEFAAKQMEGLATETAVKEIKTGIEFAAWEIANNARR